MSEFSSSDNPVLDLWAHMTADPLEASSLDVQSIPLVRPAALMALGAPAESYALDLAVAGEPGPEAECAALRGTTS